ncbi:MAG: hypothetical protein GY696_21190 [Gammaproteobacteria bacterium]|nr:hypothetical protein [Gammaproteobacteria bacterium]
MEVQTEVLLAVGDQSKAAAAGGTSCKSIPELELENRIYPTIIGSNWQLHIKA